MLVAVTYERAVLTTVSVLLNCDQVFVVELKGKFKKLYRIFLNYRVIQDILDETKQLFETENNPWDQKRDIFLHVL